MNRKNSGKLAIAGLVIIALFGVYLYRADPLGWQSNALMGSKSTPEVTQSDTSDTTKAPESAEPASAVPDTTESEGLSEDEATQTKAAQSPTPKSETPADDLEEGGETVAAAVPAFDVVRVEPDGSTLIAGHGAPDTKIEIVSKGNVLATIMAGPTGDFAVVMDEPLPAGNHEIILRAVGEDETATDSQEIAMISVPESDPTKLLVMVTKPGEASRIINQPRIAETDQPTKPDTQTAAVDDTSTAPEPAAEIVADSAADAGEQSSDMASNTQTASAETPTEDEVAAETPKGDEGAGETVAAAKENAASASESSQSETVVAETAVAETAVAESSDTATEDEAASDAVATAGEPETVVASVAADAASSDQEVDKNKPAMAAGTKLRIDAVEIEAGQIYVAGSATPGATVRVTADGEVIGTSQVSKNGRFLVEANKDIAVGEHTIGADLKLPGSTDMAMRVAVPFTRPEGELVAAVAAPVAKAPAATDTATAAVEKTDEQAASDTAGADATAVEDEDTVAAETDTKAGSNVMASVEAEKPEMAAVDTKEPAEGSAPSSTVTVAEGAADADEDTVAAETDTMAGSDNAANAEAKKPEMAAVDMKEPAEGSAPSSTVAVVEGAADSDEDTVAAGTDTMTGSDVAAGAETKTPEMAAVDTKAMDTKTPSDGTASSSAKAEADEDTVAGTDSMAGSDTAAVAEADKPEMAAVDTKESSEGSASSPATADADKVADEDEDTVAGTDTKAGTDAAASAEAKMPEVAAVDTKAPSDATAPSSAKAEAGMEADEDTVAAMDSPTGTETLKAAGNVQADGPETIMQPALEPVDSSVIIRRGDTLWQISLRIYGRGVRYTTIYLANEDEIENPDFIEPGQIFAVPEKPLDNAEELHRDRILHK